MTWWRFGLLASWLSVSGCGRYSDFTLPLQPGGSTQGRFEWQARPEPVLVHGPAGSWDAVDVLNPSVVRAGGQYLNLYSGFDGKSWHTGKAVSNDGLTWTRQGQIDPPDGTNGAAIQFRGSLLYYYQSGQPPRIGLNGHTVLELGPYASWDERGVADPYVIEAGGKLYLYYLGMDRARRQRLGLAVSSDGEHWTKLRTNPILELGGYGAFDENGLGEPAVWSAKGFYWMLYTGRARGEQRKLGLARSTDGVRWEKLPGTIAGGQPWDSQVVCDPTVMVEGDRIRVWFGGGDRPSPDQNLNGQIGYGELTLR